VRVTLESRQPNETANSFGEQSAVAD